MSSISDQFKGLPIGELIANPLIAAAQAQGKLAGITEQFIEEVGLEKFHGNFGVRSDNDPHCIGPCAVWGFNPNGEENRVWVKWKMSARWGGVEYEPEISDGAITWSCTWHGESDFPGARPDGC